MIVVVRHGETDWNLQGRMQGRKGIELNESGVKQAEKIKQALHGFDFSYVYSSPQLRAIETAEIISDTPVVVDERIDVFDLGTADGMLSKDVKRVGATPDPAIYEGVESKHSFIERIFHFMNELKAKHEQDDVHILLVGHRCTTGAIGAFFNGIPEDENILVFSSDNGDYRKYSFK